MLLLLQDPHMQSEARAVHQHGSQHPASLQPNPSAAIISGYHPAVQPDRPQAQLSSRASDSHASTATGVSLPAAQTDTAGSSSSDRHAAQAQAPSSSSQQHVQGDSPKAQWSAVAASPDQLSDISRGVSPQGQGEPTTSGQHAA